MIDHVVVAGKHAPAVRPVFHRFRQRFFRQRQLQRQNIIRPIVFGTAAIFPVFYVNRLCAVRTAVLIFTVQTPFRRPVGRVFRGKIGQIPHGGNGFTRRFCVILQKIEIMTALCQNHRRRVLAAPPVAAHVTVRLMPIRDLFQRLNLHQPPHRAVVEKLPHLAKRARIAQHMADEYLSAVFFLRFQERITFLRLIRNRLFEQDVISEAKPLPALPDVIGVQRGNDQQVGALFLKKFFVRQKTVFVCHVENFPVLFQLLGQQVAKRNDPVFVLLLQKQSAVAFGAAAAAAKNGHRKDFIHTFLPGSPSNIEKRPYPLSMSLL